MNTLSTSCPMVLLTQAELDGELDAADAVVAAAHRAGCAECQAAYHAVRAARSAIRGGVAAYEMPMEARARLLMRLREAERAVTSSPSTMRTTLPIP